MEALMALEELLLAEGLDAHLEALLRKGCVRCRRRRGVPAARRSWLRQALHRTLSSAALCAFRARSPARHRRRDPSCSVAAPHRCVRPEQLGVFGEAKLLDALGPDAPMPDRRAFLDLRRRINANEEVRKRGRLAMSAHA